MHFGHFAHASWQNPERVQPKVGFTHPTCSETSKNSLKGAKKHINIDFSLF